MLFFLFRFIHLCEGKINSKNLAYFQSSFNAISLALASLGLAPNDTRKNQTLRVFIPILFLIGYSLPDAFYVPYKASNSIYTVAALPSYFFKDVPEGGEVDVQVQALFGDFDAEPWGHLLPLEPTYDFRFTGTTSDWSNTQTVTIGESQTPTSSPAAPPLRLCSGNQTTSPFLC